MNTWDSSYINDLLKEKYWAEHTHMDDLIKNDYLMGKFQDTIPPSRFSTEFEFSYDPEIYYKAIAPYITSYQDKQTALKYIYKFIDMCLILGRFYYEAEKYGINLLHFPHECKLSFYLHANVDKNSDYYRYYHYEISICALINSPVYISVMGINNDGRSYSDLSISDKRRYMPYELIDKMRFKPNNNEMSYSPIIYEFKPPLYKELPLYINVPFVKEYVKYALMNPPPPSPYLKPGSKISFFI